MKEICYASMRYFGNCIKCKKAGNCPQAKFSKDKIREILELVKDK